MLQENISNNELIIVYIHVVNNLNVLHKYEQNPLFVNDEVIDTLP